MTLSCQLDDHSFYCKPNWTWSSFHNLQHWFVWSHFKLNLYRIIIWVTSWSYMVYKSFPYITMFQTENTTYFSRSQLRPLNVQSLIKDVILWPIRPLSSAFKVMNDLTNSISSDTELGCAFGLLPPFPAPTTRFTLGWFSWSWFSKF